MFFLESRYAACPPSLSRDDGYCSGHQDRDSVSREPPLPADLKMRGVLLQAIGSLQGCSLRLHRTIPNSHNFGNSSGSRYRIPLITRITEAIGISCDPLSEISDEGSRSARIGFATSRRPINAGAPGDPASAHQWSASRS